MIIVDTALQARAAEGRPIRVGLIGAGFMARGIANQLCNFLPGMTLAAISNRTVANAVNTYAYAGVTDVVEAATLGALEDAIASGKPCVTGDARLLCEAASIDVLIESTGAVEFGAQITTHAIDCGKDIVLMNAELDGTVGPLLKTRADKAGVIYTGCDGDQPGVQINLLRFVEKMGLRPLVCGNIKGLQDRYRNPTTQASFAKQWGQTPTMVTSFADGTKISFEQAIVGNATGMKVSQRGMIGWEFKGHVDEMTSMYDIDMVRSHGGIVDYVVGALPSPGVYVFAEVQNKEQEIYLDYGKLGKGPLYSFYVPYHLTVFEVPLSAARAVLHRDVVIAPAGKPVVDVVTAAKIDLKAGDTLDMLGGYTCYGMCENADTTIAERLLPIGIAEGATLKRPVAKDAFITYDDVELPDNLCVKLRAEQDELFFGAA
ncbi:MAG: NAD(P)H-dependent oxidoreductase [Burkholderiaceae bacterium]